MGAEDTNTRTYIPTHTEMVDYTQYCLYRLPCGICTRTNQTCPLNCGGYQPLVTWTSTSATSYKCAGDIETTYTVDKKDIEAIERMAKEYEDDITRMYETSEYKLVGLNRLKTKLS